jgi:hypothetical protein
MYDVTFSRAEKIFSSNLEKAIILQSARNNSRWVKKKQ